MEDVRHPPRRTVDYPSALTVHERNAKAKRPERVGAEYAIPDSAARPKNRKASIGLEPQRSYCETRTADG
jgi:hypothetical protein